MVFSSERLFGMAGSNSIFLWRRFVRIAPLYWLTTPIAVYAFSFSVDPIRIVKSYLFIPYSNPSGNFDPLYGVG